MAERMTDERLEYYHDLLAEKAKEISTLRAELEQERVKGAACLLAAEGNTRDVVERENWAWSPAYQRTIELRREIDVLRSELAEKDKLISEFHEVAGYPVFFPPRPPRRLPDAGLSQDAAFLAQVLGNLERERDGLREFVQDSYDYGWERDKAEKVLR